MILALELFRITEQDYYRVLARRIWLNGLQFCFRPNGGAGPNRCVDETHPILQVSFYDADQRCTMRYAEGLYWYNKKRELLQWQNGEPAKELDRYYVTLFSTFGMLKSLLKLLKTLISSGFLKNRKMETVFFRTFLTKIDCQ